MKKQETTMESIKTVEDALKRTEMPATPEFQEVPEEMRDYFKAVYQAVVITKALVADWKADWKDSNQYKWYPWFRMSSRGFVFAIRIAILRTRLRGSARAFAFQRMKWLNTQENNLQRCI